MELIHELEGPQDDVLKISSRRLKLCWSVLPSTLHVFRIPNTRWSKDKHCDPVSPPALYQKNDCEAHLERRVMGPTGSGKSKVRGELILDAGDLKNIPI